MGWTASNQGGRRQPGDPRTELQILASFFHQDFFILGGNAYDFAKAHFSGISSARKAVLKEELLALLAFRKSKKALQNEWFRLGAGSWQKELDLRVVLHDFVGML